MTRMVVQMRRRGETTLVSVRAVISDNPRLSAAFFTSREEMTRWMDRAANIPMYAREESMNILAAASNLGSRMTVPLLVVESESTVLGSERMEIALAMNAKGTMEPSTSTVSKVAFTMVGVVSRGCTVDGVGDAAWCKS